MTDYVPYQNGPLTTNILESGDTLYVAGGILVTSPSGSSDLAYARPGATNVHFTIDGTAAGIYGIGIGDPSDSIYISSSGTIRGRDLGISANGNGGIVDNDGRIISESIGVYGISGYHYNELHNSGLIQAGTAKAFGVNAAIWHESGSIGGTELIINTGTIKTLLRDSYSFLSQNTTAETIRNSGSMIGKIDLGDGSDTYDGRTGHVQGSILGGAGADTIYGGTEANVIEGDGGSDNLYGMAGADTFVFKAVGDSQLGLGRDTIRDFSHAQADKIDLTAIVTGASDGHFHFKEGATTFHKQAGELIAVQSGSTATVQGDVNGDGRADIQIIVMDGSVALHAGDFLLA